MTYKSLGAALLLSFALPLSSMAQASSKPSPAPETISTPSETPPLLAKGKPKKRKKRKKAPPPEDALPSTGPELHAKQEGGPDEPYKWQLSLLSDFSVTKTTQGENKGGTADYSLYSRTGYIFLKSLVVGLGLDYTESSYKVDSKTNSSSDFLLSLITAYNFGNLDEDEFIFFVFGQFGIGQGKGKFGDVKTSSSTTQFGLGLGMHYFMDTNVALTLEFSYVSGTRTEKTETSGEAPPSKEPDPIKFNTLDMARIGFALFI